MLLCHRMTPAHRLERSQWDFFWLPDDAEVVDRPDFAAVRCPRPSPTLNVVTRTRCAPDRVDALVDEARAFHAHGVSRWLVPDTFDTGPLERALAAAGYIPVQRHEARALRPESFRPRPRADVRVQRVCEMRHMRDCIEVNRRAFGHSHSYTEELLRERLADCADPAGRVHRFVVYRDGEPVSSGGYNWYPDLRFAFLWAGGTVPEARGAGAYSALLATRIEEARGRGAEWIGLYAVTDTSAPIVARQGFERFGEMTYWGRDDEP